VVPAIPNLCGIVSLEQDFSHAQPGASLPARASGDRAAAADFLEFPEIFGRRRELPETAVRSHLRHLMRHYDCAQPIANKALLAIIAI
jgi:hypothetical protein